MASIVGIVFRFSRFARTFRLSITPGARTVCGSVSSLIRHIIPVARAPHSISTNGDMLRPGAMLSLQRSVIGVHDQLDQLGHEPGVSLPVLL